MASIKSFNIKQFLGPKTTAKSQAEQRLKIAQPKKSTGFLSQQSILRRAIRKSKKGINF